MAICFFFKKNNIYIYLYFFIILTYFIHNLLKKIKIFIKDSIDLFVYYLVINLMLLLKNKVFKSVILKLSSFIRYVFKCDLYILFIKVFIILLVQINLLTLFYSYLYQFVGLRYRFAYLGPFRTLWIYLIFKKYQLWYRFRILLLFFLACLFNYPNLLIISFSYISLILFVQIAYCIVYGLYL